MPVPDTSSIYGNQLIFDEQQYDVLMLAQRAINNQSCLNSDQLAIFNLVIQAVKDNIGASIMLLRNLNTAEGLCNGIQLICCNFQHRVIEAKIFTGAHTGKRVFIPRITLTSSNIDLPFVLKRHQFP
ncbi:13303_t:CDS:2, partial [Cetraspora pellucida]